MRNGNGTRGIEVGSSYGMETQGTYVQQWQQRVKMMSV